MTDFVKLRETIERGGAPRYHEAAAASGKLFARERIKLLTDEGSFTEDGRFANALADGLPADGVVGRGVEQQLDGLDRCGHGAQEPTGAQEPAAARAAALTCFLVSRTFSRDTSSTTSAIER